MPRRHTLKNPHQDFSILEALVATVTVFSLGMLGIVSMHAFALQADREKSLQS